MTTMAKVVSTDAYKALKDKIDRYEKAREAFDPKRFKRGGGYSAADQAAIVKLAGLRHAPSNDDREDVSVYEFIRDKPDRLDCYIKEADNTAIFWTPRSTIGTVVLGHSYKSPAFGGFPSTRVPVTVKAINGCVYAGTYYKSSGDYARLKKTKATCAPRAGEELGGGGARAKKPTRMDELRSSLPEGWTVETNSPGDGVTRYRFFHNTPKNQTYFGPERRSGSRKPTRSPAVCTARPE
jgi:hypothetical protein